MSQTTGAGFAYEPELSDSEEDEEKEEGELDQDAFIRSISKNKSLPPVLETEGEKLAES